MTVLDLGDYEDFGISWLQHGYSFTILNPKKFSSEVLPENFPQKTMTNFIRELSRWGFTATNGGEMNTFYHKVRDTFTRSFLKVQTSTTFSHDYF